MSSRRRSAEQGGTLARPRRCFGLLLAVALLLVLPAAVANGSLTWSALTIDRNGRPFMPAVACPSTSQCTAVDGEGQEVTFNPVAPGTPTPGAIDGGWSVYAVTCVSTSQCTASTRAATR